MTTTLFRLSISGAPSGVVITATRTDTGAVVIPAATPMVIEGGGLFNYPLVDPALGLTYSFRVDWIENGQPNFITAKKLGGGDTMPRYLQLADALALAVSIPGLMAWNAAASPAQYGSLALATMDINTAMRYQGRKWDVVNQQNEFPRVAYQSPQGLAVYGNPAGMTGPLQTTLTLGGDIVWDFDAINNVAIVPTRVLMATMYQANSRVDGKRDALVEKIYNGMRGERVGSLSEQYDITAFSAAMGGSSALCREAANLMQFYRIRQGRIL